MVIKSHDRGSIFYTQKRIGQNNKEFNVYKFRTMHEGSHEHRAQIMAETNKDSRLAKDPQDPRVTKPGLFLRRWSIDEIPQIINVLKGEMSLVGPRPPLAEEVNQYEKDNLNKLFNRFSGENVHSNRTLEKNKLFKEDCLFFLSDYDEMNIFILSRHYLLLIKYFV
jgi:lipopolysaccharide/colanic/teichoic acid biosynthesis glycosyltransferase